MDPQQLLDKYVKAGNVEGVRQLLARSGTSSLDGLVNNRSPLMRAAMGNKPAMVSALLGMGASIGFTNKEGWTALHLAAKHGAVPVVDALVDAGADLEARSNSGRTPLALACRSKQLPAAKKLLDRGANTSTTDNTGWTLLFQAARAGSMEVVKWLVEELNVDPSIEVGGRPAEKLAKAKNHEEVARYLHDAVVNNLPQ